MQDNHKKLIAHLLRPHYHWQRRLPSADWSTCQLSDRAVCGNGIKTRMLDCVRSDGKSVDLKYCKEVRSCCHYRPIFATIFFIKHTCSSSWVSCSWVSRGSGKWTLPVQWSALSTASCLSGPHGLDAHAPVVWQVGLLLSDLAWRSKDTNLSMSWLNFYYFSKNPSN